MKGTLAVFSALTKSWMRSRTGVFFSIVFPVMLLLIFATVFSGNENIKYTIYVQNLDLKNNTPTGLSKAFIEAINSTNNFDIKYLSPDTNIQNYIKTHPSFTSYRILIIPEGFQEKVMNKSIAERIVIITNTLKEILELYGDKMNQTTQDYIKNGIKSLEALNQSLTIQNPTIILLLDPSDSSTPVIKGIINSITMAFNNRLMETNNIININIENTTQRTLKPIDYYLPGYIAAFIMTNGIIGVTSTTSEFRRNGILKRLASTPLSKSSWIMANLLQQTLLAFILTLIMITLGLIAFNITIIPDPLSLLLIFIGAVAFCSIGMVLGGIIKDVETAYGVSNSIAFPLMFLSGAFWPVDLMPSYLQLVAQTLPLYYFHQGLRELLIFKNVEQSYIPFIVMTSIAIIFTILAIKITKWKEFE
ncbi:MAG: ABC transporter permease [Thermoprotei archaeon]